MADVFSKKVRSRIMSRIRGTNTKPELILRKMLSSKSLRYKLHYKVGKTRIDIAFPSKKIAIFVDGCFWHGCKRHFRPPKSNKRYWGPKIKRNIERDRETNRYLKKLGWNVIRVWEHELI
jgi:DNA mismatch endonuclease (patch repair protein)